MKRTAATFLILIMTVLQSAAQIDSTKLAALDTRLGEYFSILEQEAPEVKAEECDALISAAGDPALRQAIALRIYDHYKASKLMGDEAVAIHMTDTWFIPGIVPMRSEQELLEARMFAEFNRQSLIGLDAPEMELETPYGERIQVPGPAEGPVVLYFYDTDCAKCKLETAMLRSMLDDKEYPVTVFAIYVGTSEARWKEWREKSFVLETEETAVVHLWDPDSSADLQFKYGVVQTPRMFLVDSDGVIIGRGLDTDSLVQLLDAVLDDHGYSFGSEASSAFFDRLFATYGRELKADDVSEVAGMLEQRTLALGDTLSFKQMEGDLLYWLVSKRVEPLREGSQSFINDYILSRPEIWNTGDDTLMVVGMARMMEGLLSKSPVGSRIPRMGIKGWNRFRRKGGLVFFHAEGCSVCEGQMATADSLGLDYFSVNMDALEEESPRKARKLLDTFDLSALPFIMEIDKGGIVRRRYLSLEDPLFFLRENQ
ncbi:MAG: redoxin domain-containing protein [Bacteroidales bacterium]|nr:redoxin domain-containing protein [Bacteroidales bacterium]